MAGAITVGDDDTNALCEEDIDETNGVEPEEAAAFGEDETPAFPALSAETCRLMRGSDREPPLLLDDDVGVEWRFVGEGGMAGSPEDDDDDEEDAPGGRGEVAPLRKPELSAAILDDSGEAARISPN